MTFSNLKYVGIDIALYVNCMQNLKFLACVGMERYIGSVGSGSAVNLKDQHCHHIVDALLDQQSIIIITKSYRKTLKNKRKVKKANGACIAS